MIRCKPWSSGTLLDILAESDINCIVVFRYIPVDVVQASIADLDVDVATEYELQEPDESGYHFFGTAGEVGQQPESYDPGCDVPMRSAAALVLRLDRIFQYDEEAGTELVG